MRPTVLNPGDPHKAPWSQFKRGLGKAFCAAMRMYRLTPVLSSPSEIQTEFSYAFLKEHLLIVWTAGKDSTNKVPADKLHRQTRDCDGAPVGLPSLSPPSDPWTSTSPYLQGQPPSPSPAQILTKRKASCVFACERHGMLFPKVECDNLLSQNVFNSHDYLFFA